MTMTLIKGRKQKKNCFCNFEEKTIYIKEQIVYFIFHNTSFVFVSSRATFLHNKK